MGQCWKFFIRLRHFNCRNIQHLSINNRYFIISGTKKQNNSSGVIYKRAAGENWDDFNTTQL